MRVKRYGVWYKVIDETDHEVCVEDTFSFAQPPYKRKLKCWWDKKYCQIIDRKEI